MLNSSILVRMHNFLRKPISLFDSLRLERADALSCSPHLLHVRVAVGGETVEEGVKLTGLILTSASLTEGKLGEAEECDYSVSLPPLNISFELEQVIQTLWSLENLVIFLARMKRVMQMMCMIAQYTGGLVCLGSFSSF